MTDRRPHALVPICLMLGALLGLVGAFLPASLRGLAWGVDGTALVTAAALLIVHHFRQGQDLAAAGFVVFALGQSLILSGSPMTLEASAPSFGSGAALWSVSLAILSVPRLFSTPVRVLGVISCALFALVSLQVFAGRALTPLSEPLPFFGYPFLVLTMLGWAWHYLRSPEHSKVSAGAA